MGATRQAAGRALLRFLAAQSTDRMYVVEIDAVPRRP